MKLSFLLLIGIVCLSQNLISQETWSYHDKKQYAADRADSSLWDMARLESDIKFIEDEDWPTKAAISDYPSPVPAYDWGYGYISPIEIIFGKDTLKGHSIGFVNDEYRIDSKMDTSEYYLNYFNIFIWSDKSNYESGMQTIVSRNYPHYFSSGKQKTSLGEVDWMHMNLADGHNFAIVNQRYFDLEFGRTILVVPLDDGSLRILQLDVEMNPVPTHQLMKAGPWDELKIFKALIGQDDRVREFFIRDDRL